jgi:hypothetical protein
MRFATRFLLAPLAKSNPAANMKVIQIIGVVSLRRVERS